MKIIETAVNRIRPFLIWRSSIFLHSLLFFLKLLLYYGSIGNSGQSCMLKTTMSDIQNITHFTNEWSRVYFSTNRRAMRCSQNQNIYCMHHVKCIDVAAVEPRGLFGCQCHGQVVSYFVHKHSALHVDSRCENIHNDLNG